MHPGGATVWIAFSAAVAAPLDWPRLLITKLVGLCEAGLERRTTRAGKDSIDHAPGSPAWSEPWGCGNSVARGIEITAGTTRHQDQRITVGSIVFAKS